jgi:hypothetical protein
MTSVFRILYHVFPVVRGPDADDNAISASDREPDVTAVCLCFLDDVFQRIHQYCHCANVEDLP